MMPGMVPYTGPLGPRESFIKQPTFMGPPEMQETWEELEWKKWPIVMPLYINADKALKDGRKIAKDKCCTAPRVQEISQALGRLRLPHVIEFSKRHPKDWMSWGRCRVMLVDEKGGFVNTDCTTRRALFEQVAKTIEANERMPKQDPFAGLTAARPVEKTGKEVADKKEEGAGAGSAGAGGALKPVRKKKKGKRKG